jgi:hypothetical protein
MSPLPVGRSCSTRAPLANLAQQVQDAMWQPEYRPIKAG